MDEETTQVEDTSTTVAEPEEPAQVEEVSPEEGTEPIEEGKPEEEVGSWETDKRWGEYFKNHNDTYKAYRNMEKTNASIIKKGG